MQHQLGTEGYRIPRTVQIPCICKSFRATKRNKQISLCPAVCHFHFKSVQILRINSRNLSSLRTKQSWAATDGSFQLEWPGLGVEGAFQSSTCTLHASINQIDFTPPKWMKGPRNRGRHDFPPSFVSCQTNDACRRNTHLSRPAKKNR